MGKRNVIISGGGTGGHIYPGIAIAEQLKKSHPDIVVHFVGARGGLEEKIVPKSSYPLHCLRVGRLHPSVGRLRRLGALLLLPLSFFQAVWIVLKLRPQWVLGIGGFASGPIVFVASLLGFKTAFLEPNAYPGMTNRYLAPFVRFCFVVFDKAGSFFPGAKVRLVGLPVRLSKQKAKSSQDWQGRRFRILVFGGSQGSRAINRVVADWVENIGAKSGQIELVHQIGQRDFSQWQQRYAQKHQNFLSYHEYLHNMPEQLDWADLVICRSGIGSVVEVAMASRPAIFIPLPTAADNHQLHNAEVLSEQGAAFLLEEKNLTWQSLHDLVFSLIDNPEKLLSAMGQLKEFDYSSAAEQIIGPLMEEKK